MKMKCMPTIHVQAPHTCIKYGPLLRHIVEVHVIVGGKLSALGCDPGLQGSLCPVLLHRCRSWGCRSLGIWWDLDGQSLGMSVCCYAWRCKEARSTKKNKEEERQSARGRIRQKAITHEVLCLLNQLNSLLYQAWDAPGSSCPPPTHTMNTRKKWRVGQEERRLMWPCVFWSGPGILMASSMYPLMKQN